MADKEGREDGDTFSFVAWLRGSWVVRPYREVERVVGGFLELMWRGER